jgi:hypothetical protein
VVLCVDGGKAPVPDLMPQKSNTCEKGLGVRTVEPERLFVILTKLQDIQQKQQLQVSHLLQTISTVILSSVTAGPLAPQCTLWRRIFELNTEPLRPFPVAVNYPDNMLCFYCKVLFVITQMH